MLSGIDRYVQQILQPRFEQTIDALRDAVIAERKYLDDALQNSQRNGLRILIAGAVAAGCAIAAAIVFSAAIIVAVVNAFPALDAAGILAGAGAVFVLLALWCIARLNAAAAEIKGAALQVTNHFFEKEAPWEQTTDEHIQ